jgi:hypothetical protein
MNRGELPTVANSGHPGAPMGMAAIARKSLFSFCNFVFLLVDNFFFVFTCSL